MFAAKVDRYDIVQVQQSDRDVRKFMLTTPGSRVENCSVIDWTIKIHAQTIICRVVSPRRNNNKVSKEYWNLFFRRTHFNRSHSGTPFYGNGPASLKWSFYVCVVIIGYIMGRVLGILRRIKKSRCCESLSLWCNQFWLPPVFPWRILNAVMDKLRLLRWFSCRLRKLPLIKRLELIVLQIAKPFDRVIINSRAK